MELLVSRKPVDTVPVPILTPLSKALGYARDRSRPACDDFRSI